MTVRKKPHRRAASTSVAGALASFAAVAAGAIQPPKTVTLRKGERPYWDLLMRGRTRDEWTETDLQHAGNLAACMADIERVKGDLETEGDTVVNARGTSVVNPKHTLLEVLTRRTVYLSRLLHLHAGILPVKLSELGDRRAAEESARRTADEMDDDDLLAKPSRLQ